MLTLYIQLPWVWEPSKMCLGKNILMTLVPRLIQMAGRIKIWRFHSSCMVRHVDWERFTDFRWITVFPSAGSSVQRELDLQLSCQKLESCKINFHYFIQNKEDKTNRKKGKRTGQNSSVSTVTRLQNEWLRKWRLPNMAQTDPLSWITQDTDTSAPILQCLDVYLCQCHVLLVTCNL